MYIIVAADVDYATARIKLKIKRKSYYFYKFVIYTKSPLLVLSKKR